MLGVFDLGPHEVDGVHFILVAGNPPKSVFEKAPYHYRVVAFANKVFVHMLTALLIIIIILLIILS